MLRMRGSSLYRQVRGSEQSVAGVAGREAGGSRLRICIYHMPLALEYAIGRAGAWATLWGCPSSLGVL